MSLILMVLTLQSMTVETALSRYREKTRVAIQCAETAQDDIVVCGRRAADRYRVPLIEHDPGDPFYEGAPAARERLLARTNNCQERSLFQVGCGMVGVRVSTHGVFPGGIRPIAP